MISILALTNTYYFRAYWSVKRVMILPTSEYYLYVTKTEYFPFSFSCTIFSTQIDLPLFFSKKKKTNKLNFVIKWLVDALTG